MISSLLSLIYANLRASWRKYILTGLGIAVAAFFLSAVLLLNTIISATYMAHYGNQVRNSDAVVATNISGQAKENSSGVLSVEEVEDIRNSPQVAGIREDSVVSAMYHDAPGDPVPYAISQAPTDPDLFPYQIQGRMPQNDHEILLPESLRESLHLNIGDKFHGIDPVATIKLPTPTSITNFEGGTLSLEDSLPTKEYTITGTFHSPPLGSEDSITVFAGGTMLTTTSKIAHREHKTNIVHDAHIVAVKLREGVSVEDFKREFTAHHDNHGRVVPAHEYAHKLEPDIGFANDLLTAALLGLAALALMVSAFVITNTETTKIKVVKKWFGKIADSITLVLKDAKTNKVIEERKINKSDLPNGNSDTWEITFEAPKYDSSKNEIKYTVDEAKMKGYTIKALCDDTNGHTIINIERRELKIIKKWIGPVGSEISINVRDASNGALIKKVTVDENYKGLQKLFDKKNNITKRFPLYIFGLIFS